MIMMRIFNHHFIFQCVGETMEAERERGKPSGRGGGGGGRMWKARIFMRPMWFLYSFRKPFQNKQGNQQFGKESPWRGWWCDVCVNLLHSLTTVPENKQERQRLLSTPIWSLTVNLSRKANIDELYMIMHLQTRIKRFPALTPIGYPDDSSSPLQL